jgi:uncharacterized membrane protein
MARPRRQQATWTDAYRFGLGFVMIALGILILVRSWTAHAITPPAVLMALAFVGFGGYSVYVGVVRYRLFRAAGKAWRGRGSHAGTWRQ